MAAEDTVKKLHETIDDRFDDHLERCRQLLRQKSISATGEGILETAALVKELIAGIGGKAEFCGDPAFPIVYGKVDAGKPKTLIIYGMYDVQPVEETKWSCDPFSAEIRSLPGLGPCVICRGAVNSKGALAGLFNTLRTIHDLDSLPVNLIFVIEGEEEIGSPHFESFIRERQPELKGIGVADFDFSEDTRKKVQLHLGQKGIVYMDLVCRGGRKGGPTETQHSSANAWISSPVWRLLHALTSLVDEQEKITVRGFYNHVAPVSDRDKELLRKLSATFDEAAFLNEMKSICYKYRVRGLELLEKGLFLPIINIDAVHAGYTGKGTKTVLPKVATAKLDIRFGPETEPEEVIRKFTKNLKRWGYDDIEVIVREGYTWSKTDVREEIVQKIIKAYQVHGRDPEVWPMATSSAPYFVFSRILKLPVVGGGLGHGGKSHTADEYMTVEGLRDFEKFVATYLYLLA